MPKISKIYSSKKYFTKIFYKNLFKKSTEFQYDLKLDNENFKYGLHGLYNS